MPWCGSLFRAQGVKPNKYIRFVSKPRVSDTWAWHTGSLLVLCETKGLRQDFPLLQVGKQGLIKVSTPDHSACKFVHLGPPGILWASSALRLFSNPGPKGLTKCDKIRQVLQPESFVLGCNLPLPNVLPPAKFCHRGIP